MLNLVPNLYMRGLLIGFSIAAPVGPIGVLCLRRTLAHGRASGFVSGLGAATADALYGSLAALGLTLLTNYLIDQDTWLRLIGGLFLCYLGIKTFLDKPASLDKPSPFNSEISMEVGQRKKALFSDYASTFLLTLTNPMTIISFTAIFGGIGLAQGSDSAASAMLLVAGVFSGSVIWWLLLSGIADLLRNRILNTTGLRWINITSGFVITLFGIAALVSIIYV